MWEDPIVAEVHRIRKEIAAKYGFDMAAYFADVQRRQVALGDRLVLQQKRVEPMYGLGLPIENPRTGTELSDPSEPPRSD